MWKHGKNEGATDGCDDPHGFVKSVCEDEEICRSEQLRHVDCCMLVDRMEAVESEIASRDVVEKIVERRNYRSFEYSSKEVVFWAIVRSI